MNEPNPEFQKAMVELVLPIATVIADNAIRAHSRVAHLESATVPRSSSDEPPSKWILSDAELKDLATFGDRR